MPSSLVSSIPRNAPPSRSNYSIAATPAQDKRHGLAFFIAVALVIPYSMAIYVGDLKVTAIKFVIVAFFLPAAFKLIQGASKRQRRLLAPDAYALAVFICMSSGPVIISGSRDLVGAVSQALEFYGMFVIGRAFIFDDQSLRDLTRGLQIVTFIVVALGILDIIEQRYVTQDFSFLIFPSSGRDLESSDPNLHRAVFGFSSLRAASTFDHPIMFGSVCAAVAPLHLYAPMPRIRRLFLVASCVVGCLIALSSGPLLGLIIVFATYVYDRLLHAYPERWKLFLSSLILCIATFSIASQNPLSWLIRNLTLDPQTAYWRLLIWDAGLDVIGRNPWLGVGFNPTGNYILDSSTDSLWLAKTIVYGYPMTTFLYLAPIAAIAPVRRQAVVRKSQPFLDRMCTAYTLVLAAILSISISVTFWNAIWLYFALCIGIRTSLKERCLLARRELQLSAR